MPSPAPLAILLDQDGLVVVDKPPGLPSTGHRLDDPECVQFQLAAQLRRPGRLWAVHQLDRDTSGLNLFVRRKALVETWAERLKQGRKVYLAICHGAPPQALTIVDAPLGWDEARRAQAVVADGRPARSRIALVATTGAFSLVLVLIETGRTHQVRLHMAHLGCPLVGESRYRTPPCTRHPRQALHAWHLDLPSLPPLFAPVPPDLCMLAETISLPLDDEAMRDALELLPTPHARR